MRHESSGLRIPFWVWMLVIVGVVLAWCGAGELREAMGRSHLRKTFESMHAAGRGATAADLLADLPPVDEARQDQAYVLMQRWSTANPPHNLHQELDAFVTGAEDAPESRTYLNVHRHLLVAWAELAASGPIRLDIGGWLRQDLPAHADNFYAVRGGDGMVRMALGNLCVALWAQMLLDTDPTPALTSWSQLDGILGRSEGLYHRAGYFSGTNRHDRCRLDLVRLGRMPADPLRSWLERPPQLDCLASTARSLHWDRILHGDFLARKIFRGEFNAWSRIANRIRPATWQEHASCLALFLWWPGHMATGDELACYVQMMDLYERRLSGETVVIPAFPSHYQIATLNFKPLATSAIQDMATARRTRLAARLISDHRQGLPLPPDEKALETRYGADALVVPRGPRQLYERLTERRFRIGIPATAPTSVFFDPTFVTPLPPLPKGAPADADRIGHWSLELTVRDPRPRPPP